MAPKVSPSMKEDVKWIESVHRVAVGSIDFYDCVWGNAKVKSSNCPVFVHTCCELKPVDICRAPRFITWCHAPG